MSRLSPSVLQAGFRHVIDKGDPSDGEILIGDTSVVSNHEDRITTLEIAAQFHSIEPAALTADVDDYNPSGLATADAIFLMTDGGGVRTITGIDASTAFQGRRIILINQDPGAVNILLSLRDAASNNVNEFYTYSGGAGTRAIPAGQAVEICYVGNKWMILGVA